MSDRDLSTLVGGGLTVGRLGGGDRYLCSLLSTAGPVASLRPDDGAARGFASSLQAGTALRVTFAVADGVYAADVNVERWSASTRILEVSSRSPLEFIQRRAVLRVPVECRIELLVARDGDMLCAQGATIEMSTAGFSSVLSDRLEPGEHAAAVLHLGDHTILTVVRIVLPGAGTMLPTRVSIDAIAPGDMVLLNDHLLRSEAAHVDATSS
jgi:hypothetical protein